jgi:polyisoprenoid-binding protein YceI
MAPAENQTIKNPSPTLSERPLPTYQIDPRHAGAAFKVRHMMISWVSGAFSGITGFVRFDPKNLSESQVEATIDAATVSTRVPERDRHLKSADFLDVRRYPTITFRSTKIISTEAQSYNVDGELTIRGVTRGVTLRVESLTPEIKDSDGLLRRGAHAATSIERRDFGLLWNAVLESGGFVVGDEVEITIDLELIRAPQDL